MKEIKLTQGMTTKVDDEDYEWLSQWKWFAKESRGGYYAARSIRHGKQVETIRMHRVIKKTPKGMETDHSDMDTLNNQRYNLQDVTVSVNQQRAFEKRKAEAEARLKLPSKPDDGVPI